MIVSQGHSGFIRKHRMQVWVVPKYVNTVLGNEGYKVCVFACEESKECNRANIGDSLVWCLEN